MTGAACADVNIHERAETLSYVHYMLFSLLSLPISTAQLVPNTMTSDKLLINEIWALFGEVDTPSATSSPLSETSSEEDDAMVPIPD